MKYAGAIPLSRTVESRRRSNSAFPNKLPFDVILFILYFAHSATLLLFLTAQIMVDDEKNKDERATALATRAVELVASGQAEVQ